MSEIAASAHEPVKWFMILEKRFPWGMLGWVTAVLLGVPSIYYAIHEAKPGIRVEIVSVSNVLDIHRPIPDLAISFKGQEIQSIGRAIRIVTINIANAGDKNVLQSDYDAEQPFGIRLKEVEIVGEVRMLHADSKYLWNELLPKVAGKDRVVFNKVIMEKGKSATFELTIIQEVDASFSVATDGKIAGQDDIPVQNIGLGGQIGFLGLVFAGNLRLNIVRIAIIASITMLALAALMFFAVWSHERYIWSDQRIVRRYIKSLISTGDNRIENTLLKLFVALRGDAEMLTKAREVLFNDRQAIEDVLEGMSKVGRPPAELAQRDEWRKKRMIWTISKCAFDAFHFESPVTIQQDLLDAVDKLVEGARQLPFREDVRWSKI
jgi:hypothetical protein